MSSAWWNPPSTEGFGRPIDLCVATYDSTYGESSWRTLDVRACDRCGALVEDDRLDDHRAHHELLDRLADMLGEWA